MPLQTEAAQSTITGVAKDPEPARQQSTGGRGDGETGKASGKAVVSGDGQSARKADPKTGSATSPARTQDEEKADKEEEKEHETSWGGKEAATTGAAGDVGQALGDAFNKTGKTQITDDRPQSGEVRNPADRREKTRESYTTRKSREPSVAQRTTQRIVDIWDPKNKVVRDFLYEEYSGRCQICGETNRFPRRDGKAYFEAVYLISHSEAAWTDDPGSVICLCALCSAKFQHGTVECQDIAQQIHSQKTAEEGGKGQPSISVKLIGKPVVIAFSERHLIEVQELLEVATSDPDAARAKAPGATTAPQPGLKPASVSPALEAGTANREFVRCPDCHPSAGLVRQDRLQRHIAKVHGKSTSGGVAFHGLSKSAPKYTPLPKPVKEGSSIQRCRACGSPVVPGSDYCYTHM